MNAEALNAIAPPTSDERPLARLLEQACAFDFFQAIWLLERYRNDTVPVGQLGPVAREQLRFRPDVSMGFPSTDLCRIRRRESPTSDRAYYEAEITFLGLYGVSTPLPLHYAVDVLRSTERALNQRLDPERDAADDRPLSSGPLRDFLDIFHHRLISLFYRSWLKYRYDRAFPLRGRDVLTEYLGLLIGCPPAFDEQALGLPPLRLLRYAGVLTQRPRSAETLAGVLSDYWDGLPFAVRQFVGHWIPLEEADRNRFGLVNSRLGADLTVGEQVYDISGAFNVVVGPVDWATYLAFVPGGPRFAQTRALVRLYCTDPLSFTLEVRIKPRAVPEMRLTSDSAAGALGLTSWVRTDEMGETSVVFEATEPARVGIGVSPGGVPRDAARGVAASSVKSERGAREAARATESEWTR